MDNKTRIAGVFQLKRPNRPVPKKTPAADSAAEAAADSASISASTKTEETSKMADKERIFARNSSHRTSSRRSNKYKKNKVKNIAEDFEKKVRVVEAEQIEVTEEDNQLYQKLTGKVKSIAYEIDSASKLSRRKQIRSFAEAETEAEQELYRKNLVEKFDQELANMMTDGFVDENDDFAHSASKIDSINDSATNASEDAKRSATGQESIDSASEDRFEIIHSASNAKRVSIDSLTGTIAINSASEDHLEVPRSASITRQTSNDSASVRSFETTNSETSKRSASIVRQKSVSGRLRRFKRLDSASPGVERGSASIKFKDPAVAIADFLASAPGSFGPGWGSASESDLSRHFRRFKGAAVDSASNHHKASDDSTSTVGSFEDTTHGPFASASNSASARPLRRLKGAAVGSFDSASNRYTASEDSASPASLSGSFKDPTDGPFVSASNSASARPLRRLKDAAVGSFDPASNHYKASEDSASPASPSGSFKDTTGGPFASASNSAGTGPFRRFKGAALGSLDSASNHYEASEDSASASSQPGNFKYSTDGPFVSASNSASTRPFRRLKGAAVGSFDSASNRYTAGEDSASPASPSGSFKDPTGGHFASASDSAGTGPFRRFKGAALGSLDSASNHYEASDGSASASSQPGNYKYSTDGPFVSASNSASTRPLRRLKDAAVGSFDPASNHYTAGEDSASPASPSGSFKDTTGGPFVSASNSTGTAPFRRFKGAALGSLDSASNHYEASEDSASASSQPGNFKYSTDGPFVSASNSASTRPFRRLKGVAVGSFDSAVNHYKASDDSASASSQPGSFKGSSEDPFASASTRPSRRLKGAAGDVFSSVSNHIRAGEGSATASSQSGSFKDRFASTSNSASTGPFDLASNRFRVGEGSASGPFASASTGPFGRFDGSASVPFASASRFKGATPESYSASETYSASEDFSESLGDELEDGSFFVEAYNDDGRELVIVQLSIDRKVIDLDSALSIRRAADESDMVFYKDDRSSDLTMVEPYELMTGSKVEEPEYVEVFYESERCSKRSTMYSTDDSSAFDEDDEGIGLPVYEDTIYNNVRRETFCDDQGVIRIERVGYPEKFKDQTPEDSVDGSSLERNDSSASAKKLHYIVDELKTTERKYVEDLEKVVKRYIPYIERNSPSHLRSTTEKIFGNIAKIYRKQKKFYDALERTGEDDADRLANCFIDYEYLFDLYPNYLKNKPRADVLIREFNAVIKRMQERYNEKLDFSAYLLTPLQRLGKYILFLEKIQKELGKLKIESERVMEASNMVKAVMARGNDCVAIESIENSPISKMDYGSFIMREKFAVLKPRRLECVVFLFTDVVVFTFSEQKNVELFNYCDSIKMHHLRIATFEDGTIHLTDFPKTKRKFNASKYTYVLENKSAKVKDAWREAIEKLLWQQLFKEKEHLLKVSRDNDRKSKPSRNRSKSSGSSVFYVD